MSTKPFHLGWFLQGSSIQAWGEPWTGDIGRSWMSPDLFVDLAKSLERACFDYILLEDSSYVGESYGGSTQVYLERALAVPRQDPSVVAALMAQATSRIGIVPTFGTYAYPPYLLARLVGTLDQVSAGRIGWNAVTGSSDYAAMNFGLPGMPEHDLRYEMADEYLEVVKQLWDSWEPGAIIADTAGGIAIDPAKVHAVNFEGRFFKTRGPLNSGPAPQGRPVIAQAGGSPRGREFAARHADTIVVHEKGVAAMKAYRDDVQARLRANGRGTDSCKVLFLVSPILGETAEDARERAKAREARSNANLIDRLAHLSKITNIDFAKLDLDAPLGELKTNGHQQMLDQLVKRAKGGTLRDALRTYNTIGLSVDLVGTPDSVASQMGDIVEEIGGDGYLFSLPNLSRRSIAEVEDGLVPALQQRGLVRSAYAHRRFRDNLLDF